MCLYLYFISQINMKKTLLISSLMFVTFLAGCATPTIANVGVPGSAKSVATKSIGTRTALTYISDSSINDACATQIKLMTDAKWTENVPLENKGTYVKTTYTNGTSYLVLLCSETELSATEKATKVTLTLEN